MAEKLNIALGELNLDVNPRFLPEGDYSNARNIAMGTSVSGDKVRTEKIIGTTALAHGLGYTISKVIGSCVDEATGDVYYMVTTTVAAADKIIKKTPEDSFSTIVSYDFGWTDFTLINDVFFIQDSLVWIDNSDEIKRFPIGVYPVTPTAGSLDGAEITLMKKPPQTQPYCHQFIDTTISEIRRDFDYQFATYFEYIDGGRSVLSPYSRQLSRNDSGYNKFYIWPDIPSSELEVGLPEMPSELRRQETTSTFDSFPKNAIKIVVCARNIRSNTWYEIGKINRVVDTTANNGYGKYDKSYIEFRPPLSGLAVPSTQTSPQFYVPRNPSTIEFANNKIFASNFNEGRSAPNVDVTLFQAALHNNNTPATFYGCVDIHHMRYYSIAWSATSQSWERTAQATVKYVYIDQDGFQDTDFNPVTHTPTTLVTGTGTIDLSGTGVQGVDSPYFRYYSEAVTRGVLISAADAFTVPDKSYVISGYGSVSSEAGIALGYWNESGMSFPTGGVYRVGLVFGDGFGRKSDVVVKDDWVVEFSKDYFLTSAGIRYDIQIEPQEIPSWATTVEVLVTSNVETSFFIEGKDTGRGYRYVDPDDGVIKYSKSWDTTRDYLAINMQGMVRQGIGYTFQEGDRIRLFGLTDDTNILSVNIDVPILEVEGEYILVSGDQYVGGYTDIETDGSLFLQIYRPRTVERDTILYGNGISHIITQGTRNNFQGQITGDSAMEKFNSFIGTAISGVGPLVDATGFYVTRSGADYVLKKVSLDDDDGWVYARGRAFIETNFGDVQKENYIRWGANIVNDTKINGLGDFLALDEAQTPVEHGAIISTTLIGDTQSAGSVILALTPTKPISLYIGATTLTNSDGTNAAIKSTDEIGLVRPQEADHGTLHPESVYHKDGQVFFYDAINRCFCRYSNNGVIEISKDKVSKFFRETPLETSTVRTGYYDEYETLLITVEDGYGSSDETIGFDVRSGKWRSFYDLVPDSYVSSRDVMYTSKGNVFYKSYKPTGSDPTRSNFLGTQYDTVLTIPFTGGGVVNWNAIQLDVDPASLEWSSGVRRLKDTSAVVKVENEFGQLSESGIADMVVEDNIVTSSILLDANSTGGYLTGDQIRSHDLEVTLTFESGDNVQIGPVTAIYTP